MSASQPEEAAPPNTTPPNTNNNSNVTGTGVNQKTSTNTDRNSTTIGGNRKNDRRNQFTENERTWQGDKPEIGGVLGLRTEWLDKKMSYRSFMEKMVEYILSNFDNANDVLSVVRDEVDPIVDFETNNLPKDLTEEEKKSGVKVEIQQQRIKLYMTRELELENNKRKIYGLVKGQILHSLKALLKQETDYDAKDRVQDVLWLLKSLKSLTSGLDSKSNKRCNHFDAILAFITTRQGES